jgi:hypothetical protein
VAVQNPDIPRYLRGELDNTEKVKDQRLEEQAFWFVSQALGIFEIAVSLRNEKTITSELFVTWVPWFYKLGTYDHFRKFWSEGPYALMYNLRRICKTSSGGQKQGTPGSLVRRREADSAGAAIHSYI